MGAEPLMTMKPFKELTSREEALRIILNNIQKVNRVEDVPLDKANGRVLAVGVKAGFDVPPFDRAAMDGYAVRAIDTQGASEGNPVKLKLRGVQSTGDYYKGNLKKLECVEIATGSPMPNSSDAVVMVEHTKSENNNILVYKPVKPGGNMAPTGEDMKKGDLVLEKDAYLNPGKIGALAALGYEVVNVYMKPQVVIYSSGPEIVAQGTPLGLGEIYDINSFTLSSVIRDNGCLPFKGGIIMDEKESIRKAVRDASKYDLVVFSGGSSVGRKDLFSEVIDELGDILFHGVQIKPGKPTLFGKVNDTPVFGMPGYPTSCLNNSYVFLIPTLRKMAGLPVLNRQRVTVPMGHKMESKSDREQFITVSLRDGKAYRVFKQSGNITSMTHADGIIILPIGKTVLDEGEPVQVALLNN
jgi:molybdenum cofactor synthesis domain-containing protein